jgi:hypothetical protein
MESDAAYFRRRALEEHLAALKADNPNARRAHCELAARYEELARAIVEQSRPADRLGIWF